MHLSVATLDLTLAAIAAALFLASAQAGAQAEATPAQPVTQEKQASEAIAFDRQCASPEFPLDSAPLPALSLDPGHEARIDLPHHPRPGTFKLQLLVNEQGSVVRARLSASDSHHVMDKAVLRSTEHWRFKPRYLDAKPVCAWGSYALKVEIASDAAPTGPEPDPSRREP